MLALVLAVAAVLPCSAQESASLPQRFGADASAGFGYGVISGEGIADANYGSALFRLDSFTQAASQPGPRLGLGMWGQLTIGQEATLSEVNSLGQHVEQPLTLNHAGLSAVLRHDPEASVTGTFGVGFGRIEVQTGDTSPVAMPAFTLEGGVRTKLRGTAFLDVMARAHWVTRTDLNSGQQVEWWLVELVALFGSHLR